MAAQIEKVNAKVTAPLHYNREESLRNVIKQILRKIHPCGLETANRSLLIDGISYDKEASVGASEAR